MLIRNDTADGYLSALKAISNKATGRLGYAVARNIRLLTETLAEYTEEKTQLLLKYGERDGDTVTINAQSANFQTFSNELTEYALIEHDTDIMAVPAEDVYNTALTADEIGGILFMIEEKGGNADNG